MEEEGELLENGTGNVQWKKADWLEEGETMGRGGMFEDEEMGKGNSGGGRRV